MNNGNRFVFVIQVSATIRLRVIRVHQYLRIHRLLQVDRVLLHPPGEANLESNLELSREELTAAKKRELRLFFS